MCSALLSSCVTLGEGIVFDPPDPDRYGERTGLAVMTRGAADADGRDVPPVSAPQYESQWVEAGGTRVAVSQVVREAVTVKGEVRFAHRWDDPERPVILYCGGRQTDRIGHSGVMLRLLRFGDPVMWDYPGYGDSPGSAGVEDLQRVADDLMAWAARKARGKAGDRPLILWGHSLGGFVCADLARRSDAVDGLVLEASAPSASRVAEAWSRRVPLVRLRADTALDAFDIPRNLADWDKPVLVMGSRADTVLPVELSRELADALGAGNTMGPRRGRMSSDGKRNIAEPGPGQGASRQYFEAAEAGHNSVMSDIMARIQVLIWLEDNDF